MQAFLLILLYIFLSFPIYAEDENTFDYEIIQEETNEISQKVDYMIIVGGKNSSNTKKLYDISIKNCKNVECVETVKELNINKVKEFDKIGIMAGASTPNESVEEIVKALKGED